MHSYTILSIFGLVASSSAHMKMSNPTGWFVNNSPLEADGSDFPCKGVDYSAAAEMNTYQQGQSAPLTFIGQAVHGGGSCQVSLTTDLNPTKDSVWRVIKSIEGGCPAQNEAGNMGDDAEAENPYKYEFTIPDDVPAGQYTIAWSWFNKIGNREMYMNCGPATIQGESGSQAAFNSLPVMFTANIGNDCATLHGTNLRFPNPGQVVQELASDSFEPPAGEGCDAAVDSGNTTPVSPTTPESGSDGSDGAPTPTITPETEPLPGGVFIETTLAAPQPTKTPEAIVDEPATPEEEPTRDEVPDADNSDETAPASGSGSAMPAGSACEVEGFWNCVAGNSFQRCASGTWTSTMALATGTSCTGGINENIDIRRRGVPIKLHHRFSAKMRI